MKRDIAKIKKLIIQAADKSESEQMGKNKVWTSNLNNQFIDYAHNEGFSIYSKTQGSDWGEWLYDITICKQTKDYINETFLVAESEWNSKEEEIWNDFQKLLLCNSKYKVMIFAQTDEQKRNEMFTHMENQIKLYKNSNGIFLLACYVVGTGYDFKQIPASLPFKNKPCNHRLSHFSQITRRHEPSKQH